MLLVRLIGIILSINILVAIACGTACSSKTGTDLIREPVRSGSFYPSDPAELRQMVGHFLAKAEKREIDGRIWGALVPHAGYVYSGQVAAYTYKHLKGMDIDTIILIGSCHNAYGVGLKGISVFPEGFYKTPLGLVEINQKVAGRILAEGGPFGYSPAAHNDEHSLEVQLPFLQTVLDTFTIVPILLGTDKGLDTVLSSVLTRIIDNNRTMVLVSTDMTHYPSYDTACTIDGQALEIVKSLDSKALFEYEQKTVRKGIRNLHCTFCALQPVLALMNYARHKGARHVEVLKYANSGDVPIGDKNRVVGYSAVLFVQPGEIGQSEKTGADASEETSGQIKLSKEVDISLLKLARETLTCHVTGAELPQPSRNESPFTEKRGVFVTLSKQGELRGCIGHIIPREALEKAVISNTINAASRDRRFKPVRPDELDSIHIEISVLTEPALIDSITDFVIGKHGIILKKGRHQAVFLPQVAPDQGWDKTTTLSHLSRKAGLSQDAWQNDAQFYVFEAHVFHE